MSFDESEVTRTDDGKFAEKLGAPTEVALDAAPRFDAVSAGSTVPTVIGSADSDYEYPAARFIEEAGDVTADVAYNGIQKNPPLVSWHSHTTTLRRGDGRELPVEGIDPLSYTHVPTATQALGAALRWSSVWENEEQNLPAAQIAGEYGMSDDGGIRYIEAAKKNADLTKAFVGEERYAEYMTEDVD